MNKDSRLYIIKILEQDIKLTPDGVYYSLSEPLKFSGNGDKLVLVAGGKFSEDDMFALRRDVMAKFGVESVSFTLERVPIMDCSTKPPKTKNNQMDPREEHTFTVQGRLATIFGYMRAALKQKIMRNVTFEVTISP